MTNLTPPDPIGTDPRGATSVPGASPTTPRASGPAPIPAPAASGVPGRGALAAITIAAAIIGGGTLVTVGGAAAFGAVSQITTGDGGVENTTTVDTTGVTTLRMEVGRGSATVRFDDVPTATMRSSGSGSSDWTMIREGDVLRLERPSGPFGWWIGGWFGVDPQVTLTLPRELEGELTADLVLDAGSLSTQGRFDKLSATVRAGSLTVDGGAKTVTTRVSAGSATLRLDDVATADLSMSAGQLSATMSGAQPDVVQLAVSAGSMDVTVPSGRYALSKEVSAGNLDTGIQSDPSSIHRIQASLSAGSITLREAN